MSPRREADSRHLYRVEPDPHAVVTLPDEVDVANTFHQQQLVADLDGGVVREKDLVVERLACCVFGGGEVDNHHRGRRLLQHSHPLPLHKVGQAGHCQGDSHLRKHLGHVEIGTRRKRDREPVAAVVGALRAQRHGPLDTAHLLLDGRGDRVANELRVRSGIDRGDLDRRWRDVGILRGGQRERGDPAAEHEHDRDHRRKDRPLDEKPGDHANSVRLRAAGSREWANRARCSKTPAANCCHMELCITRPEPICSRSPKGSSRPMLPSGNAGDAGFLRCSGPDKNTGETQFPSPVASRRVPGLTQLAV